MARRVTKDDMREKLVKLLPRARLEYLSGMERPWIAERKYLEVRVISRWDDEVQLEIQHMVDLAK